MSGATLADFETSIGESWQVGGPEAAVVLRLETAQPLPASMRAEGAFRLEWSGPTALHLPQGTYTFERGNSRFDIFIVPVARNGDTIRYEAVFN